MRVLKIFDGDYPWDVRVEKILRALSARGHETMLLARNRRGRPRREVVDSTIVRRLPTVGRMEPLIGFPAFFHPIWASELGAALRSFAPHRLIVRDLPLAPLALALARLAKVPVVVDLAEPYPETLRSRARFDRRTWIDRVVRNPALADAAERWVISRARRVIVVAEEAGRRLERRGLPRSSWAVVHNTPDLKWLASIPRREPALPSNLVGRRLLIFSGILVGDRGIDVALDALAHLVACGQRDIGLLVIGDGKERPRFERHSRRLALGPYVSFLGWLPHAELPHYWWAARIGLLPFRACSHINATIANKLFDYMAAGIPVLASDVPPMARVVRETGAGLTFRADDPKDLAAKILLLLEATGLGRELGRRGRESVERRYNWQVDAESLLRVVEGA